MNRITKDIFLSTTTCHTLGWINSHTDSLAAPLSVAEKFKIEEGNEIHNLARTLFPDGVVIKGDNITASNATQELLKDKKTTAILEATFITDEFITKADILVPHNNGWKIIEVKSAVNIDKKYVDDLAYTTMVAQKAELEVSSCSLMLISKDYRLGMADEKLFIENEITDKVIDKVKEFEVCCDKVVKVVNSDIKPNSEIKWECRNCDIFTECCRVGIDNHIFDLPYLGHTKFCQLREMGVVEIEDIPGEYGLTPTQEIVRKAVVSGEAVIDREGLKEALGSIVYPAYYLDFETMQTCIPIYEGVAPYSQIATQYSLHICSEAGEVVEHKEYLAEASGDCRRELAERLIGDCGSEGSILVYTSFEKTIINGLAELFPDLKGELGKLVGRLVDLYKIIRKYYYDVGFHGSYSIKKVLPVLVPDMGYDDLEIGDGLNASAVYAYMCRGKYSREEESRIREQLKLYCGVDTMAMVRLVGELGELI